MKINSPKSNNPQINTPRVSSPLGRRLLILVVLFSSIITIVISVIQLNSDYKRDINNINSTLQSIKDVHLESLTSNVWTADSREINKQLDGMLHLPSIQYLEIIENNNVLASAGIKQSDNILKDTVDLIFQHRNQTLNIGTLNIQATLTQAYEHLVDQAISIVVSNAIKTFLVSAFILFLFYQLFTRHLHSIAGFTQNLNLNNLDQTFNLDRKTSATNKQDELDILTLGISSMQQNLSESITLSKEKDAHYKRLVESSTAIPWELDLQTWCFTYVGPQARNIFGYPINNWYQKNFWVDHIHPEDRDNALNYCESSTNACKDHTFEYRMLTANDKTIWIKDDVQVVIKEGKPVKLQGYMFDITQRKLAEIELANYQRKLESLVLERTKDLEASNQELEAFCYSVSHDLRSPLRTISGFAQILHEDNQHELTEESIDYLNRVINGCRNMGELIDALLDLSRVTRRSFDQTEVNLSDLFQHAIDLEIEDNSDRIIDIKAEPDLNVIGDRTLLRILMNNLVNNACKYTSNNDKTTVIFGCKIIDNQQHFFISDNGTGFNPEYASKLFAPFQRLHNEKDFEGTGIGLATVQRIVTRHNGKIWAESIEGDGATFWFTLNEKQKLVL